MLIDEFLAVYDFSERHETTVNARVDQVYSALNAADFSSSATVTFLLAVRAFPERLLSGRADRAVSAPKTLRDAERFGFYVVAENPPVEIVIALQGKFWTVRGGSECSTREALDAEIPAGTARAVWNFSIRPTGPATCILATETRVKCADASARRRFLAYWIFVRPGSGIIRRSMLRTIRTLAERAE